MSVFFGDEGAVYSLRDKGERPAVITGFTARYESDHHYLEVTGRVVRRHDVGRAERVSGTRAVLHIDTGEGTADTPSMVSVRGVLLAPQ